MENVDKNMHVLSTEFDKAVTDLGDVVKPTMFQNLQGKQGIE